MNHKKAVVGMLFLAGMLLGNLIYKTRNRPSNTQAPPAYQYKVGDELSTGVKAPVTDLVSLDQETISLGDYLDQKPLVLIFGEST